MTMAARRPFNRDEKVEVKMQDGEFAGAVYGGMRLFVDESELRIHQRTSILTMARYFFNCQDEVEVKLTKVDFAGGFYEGEIIKTWKRRCEVRLRCLPDNTTGQMMVDRQGWWSGVLEEVIGDDVYDVSLLKDGTPLRVCDLSLRITQAFSYVNPPKWQYNKR
ncbi:hypothetical protein L1887_17879 [Cichorium endivia]|nr:hypothetical protein L1887_17879 [Cichorium endivia]